MPGSSEDLAGSLTLILMILILGIDRYYNRKYKIGSLKVTKNSPNSPIKIFHILKVKKYSEFSN